MLSIKAIKAKDTAKMASYYEGMAADSHKGRDEYYEAGGEPPGYWMGRGSQRMGLEGEVQSGQLRAAMEGYHPATGEVMAKNAGPEHKPGWDATFSAPKSVSVAWAVADQETRSKLEEAHRQAVAKATNYLEREAIFTRHGHGGAEKLSVEYAGGIIAAAYEHSTSRAGDPNLHTHVIIMNNTPDGRGIDLDTRYKMAAGALYRAELAYQLREQGFAIERDRTSFKLAGSNESLNEFYSKRREEIERELAKRGRDDALSAERATLKTRAAKEEIIPREELFKRWESEGRQYGYTAESVRAQMELGKDMPLTPERTGKEVIEDRLQNDSTLSGVQVVAAIAQESQGYMNADQAEAWAKAVMARELVYVGRAPDDKEDWHKDGDRYTTREVIELEREMMARVETMKSDESHQLKSSSVQAAIDARPTMSEKQQDALRYATQSSGAVAVIEGHAGAGKSYLMAAVREAYESEGYRVYGTATSQQATQNLEKEAGIASMNTAKLRYELDNDRLELDSKTVLVIDEAGMIGNRSMNDLLSRAEAAGAKVILTGDTRQVPAVEAGSAMRAIAERVNGVELDEVRRQKGDEIQLVNALRHGDAEKAIQFLDERSRLHATETAAEARLEAAKSYLADHDSGKTSLVMASTRAEVRSINEHIRDELKEQGRLGEQEVTASTAYGRREFAESDRVIFREKYAFGERDDKSTTVWNGATGTVVDVKQVGGDDSTRALIYVQLDHSKEVIKVDTEHMNKLDHGYASTIHTAQGATVDRAHFVATSDFNARELSYVAGSRHREEVHIYTTNDRLESGDLAKEVEMSAAKDNALDYITKIEHLPAYEAREKSTDERAAGREWDREIESLKQDERRWEREHTHEAEREQVQGERGTEAERGSDRLERSEMSAERAAGLDEDQRGSRRVDPWKDARDDYSRELEGLLKEAAQEPEAERGAQGLSSERDEILQRDRIEDPAAERDRDSAREAGEAIRDQEVEALRAEAAPEAGREAVPDADQVRAAQEPESVAGRDSSESVPLDRREVAEVQHIGTDSRGGDASKLQHQEVEKPTSGADYEASAAAERGIVAEVQQPEVGDRGSDSKSVPLEVGRIEEPGTERDRDGAREAGEAVRDREVEALRAEAAPEAGREAGPDADQVRAELAKLDRESGANDPYRDARDDYSRELEGLRQEAVREQEAERGAQGLSQERDEILQRLNFETREERGIEEPASEKSKEHGREGIEARAENRLEAAEGNLDRGREEAQGQGGDRGAERLDRAQGGGRLAEQDREQERANMTRDQSMAGREVEAQR